LGGTNASVATNNYGKAQSKALDTGWSPAQTGNLSDTLTLWGLAGVGAAQSDTIVVSVSFHPAGVTDAQINSGLFCLGSLNANGIWVNAVDANVGGAKTFVKGPWNASYGLGAYGVDKDSGTAWAVVNNASRFAVVQLPPALAISGLDAQGNVTVTWPASLLPGYLLQYCPDLATTNWVTVGNQGFFRLVKP
jgi:hypothetical protein